MYLSKFNLFNHTSVMFGVVCMLPRPLTPPGSDAGSDDDGVVEDLEEEEDDPEEMDPREDDGRYCWMAARVGAKAIIPTLEVTSWFALMLAVGPVLDKLIEKAPKFLRLSLGGDDIQSTAWLRV